ncbi:MAG: hypothetical protein AAGJ34_00855 [Pseudomonadota bacterium]
MELLVLIGAVISSIGLVGLFICILRAYRARKEALTSEEMAERLRPLVTLNLVALFGSVIGLMLVVLGLSLS